MAKMTVKGSETVSAMLEAMGNDQEIAGRIIYEGAAVVYKHLKGAVDGLEVHSDGKYGGIRPEYKAGLQESLGIAPHKTGGGSTDTSVGFDGYNGVSTARWPGGMPNAVVARMVERGASWFPAQPFVKKAKSAAKGPAEEAMEKQAQEELEKYLK